MALYFAVYVDITAVNMHGTGAVKLKLCPVLQIYNLEKDINKMRLILIKLSRLLIIMFS